MAEDRATDTTSGRRDKGVDLPPPPGILRGRLEDLEEEERGVRRRTPRQILYDQARSLGGGVSSARQWGLPKGFSLEEPSVSSSEREKLDPYTGKRIEPVPPKAKRKRLKGGTGIPFQVDAGGSAVRLDDPKAPFEESDSRELADFKEGQSVFAGGGDDEEGDSENGDLSLHLSVRPLELPPGRFSSDRLAKLGQLWGNKGAMVVLQWDNGTKFNDNAKLVLFGRGSDGEPTSVTFPITDLKEALRDGNNGDTYIPRIYDKQTNKPDIKGFVDFLSTLSLDGVQLASHNFQLDRTYALKLKENEPRKRERQRLREEQERRKRNQIVLTARLGVIPDEHDEAASQMREWLSMWTDPTGGDLDVTLTMGKTEDGLRTFTDITLVDRNDRFKKKIVPMAAFGMATGSHLIKGGKEGRQLGLELRNGQLNGVIGPWMHREKLLNLLNRLNISGVSRNVARVTILGVIRAAPVQSSEIPGRVSKPHEEPVPA